MDFVHNPHTVPPFLIPSSCSGANNSIQHANVESIIDTSIAALLANPDRKVRGTWKGYRLGTTLTKGRSRRCQPPPFFSLFLFPVSSSHFSFSGSTLSKRSGTCGGTTRAQY